MLRDKVREILEDNVRVVNYVYRKEKGYKYSLKENKKTLEDVVQEIMEATENELK